MSLFYSIKTRLLSACTIGFLLCQTQTGWAQLNVITTTEDIAALVRVVGGKWLKVESLSRGYQDTHFVPAKPSLMILVHKADLLIFTVS